MELLIERLSDNITRLTPVGRWDVKGAADIDLKFSAATGAGRGIIVDLSEVDYLSSMGIRSLILGAKAAGSRGGKLVLLSPRPSIAEVLSTAQIDQLIPMHHDLAAAQNDVSA